MAGVVALLECPHVASPLVADKLVTLLLTMLGSSERQRGQFASAAASRALKLAVLGMPPTPPPPPSLLPRHHHQPGCSCGKCVCTADAEPVAGLPQASVNLLAPLATTHAACGVVSGAACHGIAGHESHGRWDTGAAAPPGWCRDGCGAAAPAAGADAGLLCS